MRDFTKLHYSGADGFTASRVGQSAFARLAVHDAFRSVELSLTEKELVKARDMLTQAVAAYFDLRVS